MIINLLLMALFFGMDGASEEIKLENQYSPPGEMQVVMNERGEIFRLDSGQANIEVLSLDGGPSRTISRRGEGPGELAYPRAIYCEGDSVFVADLMKGIIHFQRDGKYVAAKTMTMGLNMPIKIAGGWVLIRSAPFPDAPSELVWMDDTFQHETVLEQFDAGASQQMAQVQSNGSVEVRKSIAQDQERLAAGPGGHQFYLYKPMDKKILCYSSADRTISHEIKLKEQKLKLDESMLPEGVKKVVTRQVMFNGVKTTARYILEFPEYLPRVVDMAVDASGFLHIMSGAAMIRSDAPAEVFDSQGKPAESPFSLQAAKRTLMVKDGNAYVLFYDTESSNTHIRRLPIAEVDKVVAQTNEAYFGSKPYQHLLTPEGG